MAARFFSLHVLSTNAHHANISHTLTHSHTHTHSHSSLLTQSLERGWQALGLENYQDFEVVLAMCWKLDNESYARILGDDSVREDQLSSFLGSL